MLKRGPTSGLTPLINYARISGSRERTAKRFAIFNFGSKLFHWVLFERLGESLRLGIHTAMRCDRGFAFGECAPTRPWKYSVGAHSCVARSRERAAKEPQSGSLSLFLLHVFNNAPKLNSFILNSPTSVHIDLLRLFERYLCAHLLLYCLRHLFLRHSYTQHSL